jgi:hypothetical protein
VRRKIDVPEYGLSFRVVDLEEFADAISPPNVIAVSVCCRRPMPRKRNRNLSGRIAESKLQAVERVLDTPQDGGLEARRFVDLTDLRAAPHDRREIRRVEIRSPLDAMRAAGNALGTGDAVCRRECKRTGTEAFSIQY